MRRKYGYWADDVQAATPPNYAPKNENNRNYFHPDNVSFVGTP